MASFPSTATSVFQGMAAPLWASITSLPRPLPKFKLVPNSRPAGFVAELSSVIESEVVPRLALAHADAAADPQTGSAQSSVSTSPETFARLVLQRDAEPSGALVAQAIRDGAHSEALYEDLLAPTALLFADLWRDDRLSYTEVTIGLTRLQTMVRGLPDDTAYNGDNNEMAQSALFAPRPGEQQTFGFYMVEERFRWGGWRTWIETQSTGEGLVANVRGRWFDMVCLSVSRADNLEDLTKIVASIRRASCNRRVAITVDGAPFIERPDWLGAIGADAVASRGGGVMYVVDRDPRRAATA